jgi:hypothetical protein
MKARRRRSRQGRLHLRNVSGSSPSRPRPLTATTARTSTIRRPLPAGARQGAYTEA